MARRKRRKKLTKYYLIILFAVFGICLAAALVVYRGMINYNEVLDASNSNYYTITVEPGMNGKQIAEMLQQNGIIKNSSKFRKRAQILGYDSLFQAGEYQLSPSMSTEEIYYALQNAKRETVNFTIPEGLYLREVAEKLVKDGLLKDVNDFYQALLDDYPYSFIPSESECIPDPTNTLSAKANRLEGFLYPNTYQVFKGASAHDIIDKMLSGFESIYTDDFVKKANSLGLSTKDVITIASLIERETMVDSEREKVSSVIYNRLKLPMRLQLDASVQYALGEHKTRVLYEDLEIKSAYNTYVVDGIGAGPIASPGLASIEAALYPAETDFYYYVLKPDNSGQHNFAKTMQEFENYNRQYKNSL